MTSVVLAVLAWRLAREMRSLKADHAALEQGLELLSRSDPLTGVFNRRRFDEALETQLAYARSGNGRCAAAEGAA